MSGADPHEHQDMPDEHHRRGRVRWWVVAAALGGALAIAAAVTIGLFVTRDVPDPKPITEVLDEFRRTTTSPTAPSTAPSTTTGPALLRPPAGVYVLEGAGREEISFLGVGQDDGATMPATVAHLAGGCWTFTIHYNEAHWQDWTLCPDGDRIMEMGGHTFQSWDFGVAQIDNLSTFVCDPPILFAARRADGSPWARTCRGTNEQVEGATANVGTLTFIGLETLDIGGDQIEAAHLRRETDVSGAQSGEESGDLWIAVADGLPLRAERDVRIASDSPIGEIVYTEQGWWQLTTTEPAS